MSAAISTNYVCMLILFRRSLLAWGLASPYRLSALPLGILRMFQKKYPAKLKYSPANSTTTLLRRNTGGVSLVDLDPGRQAFFLLGKYSKAYRLYSTVTSPCKRGRFQRHEVLPEIYHAMQFLIDGGEEEGSFGGFEVFPINQYPGGVFLPHPDMMRFITCS